MLSITDERHAQDISHEIIGKASKLRSAPHWQNSDQ
jgi:hypothetical protein